MTKRYRQVNRVLWVVLVLNYGVCALKLVVGSLAGSASIIADGFHSLSDGSSNIVGLVGMSLAAKPADHDHAYGHAKYETLTATGIAAMLFVVALEVVKSGWDRLLHPVTPTIGFVQFAVMVATMGINLLVTLYEAGRGRALKSDVLVSDAAHTRSDLYVSASVLVGLVFVRLGFPIADAIASIFVGAPIVKVGADIVRDSSRVLCDAAVLDPEEVAQAVIEVRGVAGCHKVRSRGRQDQVFLDLHVQVDEPLDLVQTHALGHLVSERLRGRFPNVYDVSVHVEPSEARSARRAAVGESATKACRANS
ncbi:MAG TPA: cation diffusion facilitator family transporter [Bacillota bacterium]